MLNMYKLFPHIRILTKYFLNLLTLEEGVFLKKSDKRFRRFDVQRNYQYETHNDKGDKVSDITEFEWRKKVISEIHFFMENSCVEIIYAFHDKDINDDGTSKGLHIHMVVTFKDAKTQTSAIKLLGASSTYNCQPCNSYVDSVRYLSHRAEDAMNRMKYPYNIDVVKGWRVVDNIVTELNTRDVMEVMSRKNDKKARKEKKKVKDTCAVAVMTGDSVTSDVLDIYMRDTQGVGLAPTDYLQDMSLYERASDVWLRLATNFYQCNPCPLTSIYISGGGGTGKTMLANALADRLADNHGVHQVSAPGKSTTFDFVGNYRGERVSIFNELSSAFPVEQFLSIFDPLNAVPVNSRHADKLYFANYSIFTTSVPLETFIYNLWLPYAKANSKIPIKVRDGLIRSGADELMWLSAYQQYLPKLDDKILQIRRRLPIQVNISNGYATIYLLDKNFNTAESFAFIAPQPNKEPYGKLKTLPYNSNNTDNFNSQIKVLADSIIESIDFYYKMNEYQHPNSFKKPDFSKLLK